MRTALIGGASKGLGLGCASALVEAGHRVIMCARNEGILEESAEKLRCLQGTDRIITIPCDWSDRHSLSAMIKELEERSIEVDILINNVGGPKPGKVTETSEEEWETGLDLLFRSTLRLYAQFVPAMRTRKWGRIVNILSTTVIEPVPILAVSSVLRAGLACYAKLTALEVARDGVTVNSLMPGGFITARTEELERLAAAKEGISPDAIRQRISNSIPLGRMLSTSELGSLVTFLCSDLASGLSGLLVPIDGLQLKSI